MDFDWSPYCIDTPIENGGWSYTSFPILHHIAHVGDARRIVEDGVIRSGLIFDESKLNMTRLCVIWTSPNTWAHGSLYGNVVFSLDTAEMLSGRHFYKVEVMRKYNPHAIRILVSTEELPHPELEEFDPLELGHPIHRDSDGTWHRLNKYNYELMLAEQIGLDRVHRMSFVDHHATLCNKLGSACDERSRMADDAAAEFMAWVVGSLQAEVAELLWRSAKNGGKQLDSNADAGLGWLLREMGNKSSIIPAGTMQELLRAALLAYGVGEGKVGLTAMKAAGTPKDTRAYFLELLESLWNEETAEFVRRWLPRRG